ncbi:hypothetical protein [Cellulomonas sp. PhB150]|uniref:hypothetical protein n=1 Tax=Cellulomonas sp. PhB150 TaxID=2485188 RepID=UPI001315A736|nr:hypothetical protein [Cellulomonas sp. PhB150]
MRVQALLDVCAPYLADGEGVLGIALLSDETTPGDLFVVVTTARIARLHVAGRSAFVGEWAADIAALGFSPVVVHRRDGHPFVVGRLRTPADAHLLEFALWHHG